MTRKELEQYFDALERQQAAKPRVNELMLWLGIVGIVLCLMGLAFILS